MESEILSINRKLFDHSFDGDIDPLLLFDKWLQLASTKEDMANAMSLATVAEDGLPNVRTVLLKDRTARGFVFYTNKTSVKGAELANNPRAALGFFWKSLNWQVRVRGQVSHTNDDVADRYFKSRPLGARIGAHASKQSRPLARRQDLVDLLGGVEARFRDDVPRPAWWGGYIVCPTEIEFWCDGESRLHDRIRFSRQSQDGCWVRQRLFP